MMQMYLNRPIFPFLIDWGKAVERSLTYDLRETALGYGAEYFTPTAEYTVTGWDFPLYHTCGEDILDFECFADSLLGRLQGFWLPCPLQIAVFKKALSAQVIQIKNSGYAQVWNERPDQFLLFTFADGTQAGAQIAAVSTGDASGTWPADLNIPIDEIDPDGEYIILKAPLPEVPAATTIITKLHYVRFAQDVEQITHDANGVGAMQLSVIELPLEYTNAETGLQPIYLYHFWMKAPVLMDWFYTSFAAPVASSGKLYQPWSMTHGSIKQTTDGNSTPVDITAKPDDSHPFSLLAGVPPGCVLWVDIIRCYLPAPDAQTKIFSGFVSTVEDDGVKYTAHCNTRLQWLKTKLPRFYIGTKCNWMLYDPNTCAVGEAFFETTVTIQAVVAGVLPQIQCSFNFGFQLENWQKVNWFQNGTLEAGVGLNYEIRSIIASQWVAAVGNTPGYLLLTLSAPLKKNGVNAQCQITAGCDHTANGPNGCVNKFNNFNNFGGFVDVPEENLSLEGINTSNAMGGKKA